MRDDMDKLKGKSSLDFTSPMHLNQVPGKALEHHVEDLNEHSKEGTGGKMPKGDDHLSLSDDRRVKVLSPGALVIKRFFRNRLAVVGLSILVAMFLFSFVGGFISPYGQDEQFFTHTDIAKEYVGVVQNKDFRYLQADGQEFGSIVQAKFLLAQGKKAESFEYKDVTYQITEEGKDLYAISAGGTLLSVASKDIVNTVDGGEVLSFEAKHAALKAYANDESGFTAGGESYTIDTDGNIFHTGNNVGYVSRLVVKAAENGVTITRDFKTQLEAAINSDQTEFVYPDANGEESRYTITYKPDTDGWAVTQNKSTYVYDRYRDPSLAHPLGTDGNGMDMLTRLMYGGRVSLVIGFIVVLIAAVLGVLVGGISGYFGGWIDSLCMRVVDVFYCIPMMPIVIILGSTMDQMRVDPQLRMVYLMMLLGFLSWPSIARLVRGQILSLREQEFMTATEACGVRVSRRIFRHLIPNVIPQLIVVCTMSLGSTIITEATLSFLGLGVKFPFASWGNIMNDVNNSYVLTNYWFIWIPAGICLLLAVLGFNFVGDGLRDAFDPKMKR